jgi:hypothetical protein
MEIFFVAYFFYLTLPCLSAAVCDPLKFGTPMFYAVSMRKYRCVDMLDLLGVSVNSECDVYKQSPMSHALRNDDPEMVQLIEKISGRALRVANFFYNNYLRAKSWRWFKLVQRSIKYIQKVMRGKLGRKRAKKKRIKKKKLEKKNKIKDVVIDDAEEDEKEEA